MPLYVSLFSQLTANGATPKELRLLDTGRFLLELSSDGMMLGLFTALTAGTDGV